jgi:vesicle transport through interaction with t-SNAREs 1
MSSPSSAYVSFDRYADEFQSLTSQLEGCLEAQDDDDMDSAGHLLSQCEEILQQMALEARSVSDAGQKRELLGRVRTAKAALEAHKTQYERQSLMASSQRNAGSGNRERLLQQQDMLKNQNSKLDNARRVIEETEQVALEITSELHSNRDTLESAHGRIREVSGLTGRARRIVSGMMQRRMRQRIILWTVSGVIIFVFVLFVWRSMR